VLLEGTHSFDASREDVFAALTDPELVAETMPGVEGLDLRDRDHWTAHVKLPIAPRMKMQFEVQDRRPPEHARLHAHGKSFGAGITLDTEFDLAGQNGQTEMRYLARFALGGMLGRLGEGALQPVAERQIAKLLAAVGRRVESS
jgi:carbon monoxide dehydrogenase subunit G